MAIHWVASYSSCRLVITMWAAVIAGCITGLAQDSSEWWVQTQGIYGGEILSLAVDPLTPSTLYAGTRGGLFRSIDGGGHWTAADTGLTNPSIDFVLIDPLTPSTLYAGTHGGLHFSTDRGEHWSAVNDGATQLYTDSLAIDPQTPSTLYAGTDGGGVLRSTDRGLEWTAVNDGLAALLVFSLAVDPETTTTLYAGTSGGGAFRSVDQGEHWTTINQGLSDRRVSALKVDPVVPSTLYAGTGGGVFRSTDHGEHWKSVSEGLASLTVVALVIDALTPPTLYAGTLAGVFRSRDGGEHWTAVNNGMAGQFLYVWCLAIDPVSPDTLYAGMQDGVFRTTDQGDHWTAVNSGLSGPNVWSLAVDPVTPSTLYSGTNDGIFRSTDRGEHWLAVNDGLAGRPVFFLAIDPLTPSSIYAATYGAGVFHSTDRGDHWTPVSHGLTQPFVRSLAIDPLTPSTLYAGGSGGGVFRLGSGYTPHFSQFGKGLGFTSDVVLTNPSAFTAVSGTIAPADDLGEPLVAGLEEQADFSIRPQGTLTLSTDGEGDLAVGSAKITANGRLSGVVRFGVPGIGIAGVGSSQPVAGFIAPVRRVAGGINTGIALANPEPQAINLSLTLRNLQGQEVLGGRKTIEDFPSRGHLARFVDELFPDAQTNDFQGTLTVETENGEVAGTALELGKSAGQFTTLPVTPLGNAGESAESYFAQFGGGAGFASDTVLINPSADRFVTGTVAFLDDRGEPMVVGVSGSGRQSSQAFSIPPLGAATISTLAGGALNVGSAHMTSDGPVGGVVRFQIPGIGIAGVGASRALDRFLIPVRRTPEGLSTGLALQNAGDTAVTVALTLRDTKGTPVPGGTVTLPELAARGHIAQFLQEIFPDADTSDFSGTVSVKVSGGVVAATALELGLRAGEFTTLPVTPVE